MRNLVPTRRFERAFRRLTAKNPALQAQIETTLRRMAENLADPRLKNSSLERPARRPARLLGGLRLPDRLH
jgi:hypothetical protein